MIVLNFFVAAVAAAAAIMSLGESVLDVANTGGDSVRKGDEEKTGDFLGDATGEVVGEVVISGVAGDDDDDGDDDTVAVVVVVVVVVTTVAAITVVAAAEDDTCSLSCAEWSLLLI